MSEIPHTLLLRLLEIIGHMPLHVSKQPIHYNGLNEEENIGQQSEELITQKVIKFLSAHALKFHLLYNDEHLFVIIILSHLFILII